VTRHRFTKRRHVGAVQNDWLAATNGAALRVDGGVVQACF